MRAWHDQMQRMLDEIDACIRAHENDEMTLHMLSERLGYSAFYISRKFREISGMQFRAYLRLRRLAFALCEVRDTHRGFLEIALDYGFSSHEAFTRAFREAYGVTPSAYRRQPAPVSLRTCLHPFDCYLIGKEENGMMNTTEDVKTYFVTIPAHKFLHIRNYESIGFWDFWQKQNQIPGQDCETICTLLAGVKGKLDDLGDSGMSSGSGQVIAYINEPTGRICSWGIPLAEAYGARLPVGWQGEVPPQMQLMDVPEGEYVVFEHGPFDAEKEIAAVEARIEAAMKAFDYPASGYALDMTPGRVFYYFHDPARYFRYVRPVKRCAE